MIFTPAQLPFYAYAAVWCGMALCEAIWVLYWSIGSEILPSGKASIGLGMMNGMSVMLSSIIAPIYGTLVDITGSYFTPNIMTKVMNEGWATYWHDRIGVGLQQLMAGARKFSWTASAGATSRLSPSAPPA